MTAEFGIATKRLRLRWLTLDDAGLLLDVWNDPAFIRNVGDRGVRTVEEVKKAMQNGGALHLYETYAYGPYRVALQDDDVAIGIVGLFRRDGLDIPDLGYSVLPQYCGKGYAYEASCAVIDYARDELALDQICAIISPDNAVSIGLIEKLGFEFERMHLMPDDDEKIRLYGMRFAGED
jgi:RimJ/RimL family protein N-acetyltransferase